jgi:hypothetical protein
MEDKVLSEKEKERIREEAHHKFTCLPPIAEDDLEEKLPESISAISFTYKQHRLDAIAN